MLRDNQPMAVIDMGATAIRLAVAEVRADGTLHLLDRLQQNVTLGYETFVSGSISLATVEACVEVLRAFTDRIKEYRIPIDRDHVRVVATSAVREAANRDAFVDRIYIATGLEVEVVEECELSRFTYLSIQPFMQTAAFGPGRTTLIVEVGGGNTEVLAVRDGRVLFSQAHRLGALRMWQLQDAQGTPASGWRQVMEAQIGRATALLQARLGADGGRVQIVAMGGDARFAATRLQPGWDRAHLTRVSVAKAATLVERILDQSEEELVRRHFLSYPEAETLGPALLTYVCLTRSLGLPHFYVTDATMRDGVLSALAGTKSMTDDFHRQIVNSATSLGRRYAIDEAHVQYVTAVADALFVALQDRHGLTARHRLILQVASLLHEIGMFVSTPSHHKHSMYLIQHSDIFGLDLRDRNLAAIVARYHRRAHPLPIHEGYGTLGREDRIDVCKLAAILRVADAMDRSHAQRLGVPRVEIADGVFRLVTAGIEDLNLERLAMEQKGALFEQVYGLRVHVQSAG